MIVLDVTDCSQLEQTSDADPSEPVGAAPSVTLRSLMGTSTETELSWFSWSHAELVATGTCG